MTEPSRETAKPEAEPEPLIAGPPQSERPTFGEDKEWDSRRSAAHEPFVKRAAEPALSAEGEADLLPAHVADALIHQVKSGESFDKSVMLIALGQLRDHLSRGQG